jgi:hypothetical protein
MLMFEPRDGDVGAARGSVTKKRHEKFAAATAGAQMEAM